MKKNQVTEESNSDQWTEISKGKRVRIIIAGFLLVMPATFTMIHLGFMEEMTYRGTTPPKQFLTFEQLWMINAVIGAVAGLIGGAPKWLAGILGGLVSAVAMTGATWIYLFWRDTILMAEIIVPMLAGLLGIAVFQALTKKKETDAYV